MFSISTVGSFQAHVNPYTGQANCPDGFSASAFGGVGYEDANGEDSNYQLFYCAPNSAPRAGAASVFGGIYTVTTPQTLVLPPPPPFPFAPPLPVAEIPFAGSFQSHVNPYTGAASCPTGFSSFNFAGAGYSDASRLPANYQMYFCALNQGATPSSTSGFGGIFSMSTVGTFQAHANSSTGADTCPLNFRANGFAGAGFLDANGNASNYQLYFCGSTGLATPTDFGGIFSISTVGSFQAQNNPYTGQANCPPGFSPYGFGGVGYDDANGAPSNYQLYYCAPNSAPPAGSKSVFGGIYTFSTVGTFQAHSNPYSELPSCPVGFSTFNFAGAGYADASNMASNYQMFFCALNEGAKNVTGASAFGGIFSMSFMGSFQAHPNAYTDGNNCLPGFQVYSFAGAGFLDASRNASDYQLYFCAK